MLPKALDHVALWVADRASVAGALEQLVGLHTIDRQETFTLLGDDARRGKLTLFDAEGPRERGPLLHVGLGVPDLERARARLPAGAPTTFDAGEGLRLHLVQARSGAAIDLDHVVLASPAPEAAAEQYERLGFRRDGPTTVSVGGARLELRAGRATVVERPLLNHLAVLVDSADEHVAEARRLGVEVESVVDAENTRAAFLVGPDGVRVEYVEHKPSFSLT